MSQRKSSSVEKTIPLIRPQQVPVSEFWPIFKESVDSYRLANHGPCYLKAQKLIEERMTFNCMVSNATVGLELCLRARFKQSAKILMPSFTFKATYIAVKNAGMIPVVVPVDRNTWALDPSIIKNVDGAIVVAPFGHSIDFSKYDGLPIPIVYDLAGAWGLDYKGTNIAVYSWHATKNFCVGEGACIVSKDSFLIREIERLSNFGHTNAKISEIQCAIACALLLKPRKEKYLTHDWYSNYFLEQGFAVPSNMRNEHCSLFAFSFPREKLYSLLSNTHFEARRYYYPLIEDMYDCEVVQRTPDDHPTRTTVALPRDVTEGELRQVIETVQNLSLNL